MKSVMTTVTNKGQVTVPSEIRKHLGLRQGSRIAFVLDDEGRVTTEVPKYPSVASLQGAAGSLRQPLPWAQVQAMARSRGPTEHAGGSARLSHPEPHPGTCCPGVVRSHHPRF